MGNLDQIPHEISEFQKNQTKFTKIMIILACVTVGAALSTVYLSVQTGEALNQINKINNKEFELANFESEFNTNEPQIVLNDPYKLPQFEYKIPLELSTLTSHHYRYTVSTVQNSIEMTNDGICLFDKPLEILSVYPTTFFLSSNGDEKTIEPRFLLSAFPKYTAQENTIRTTVAEAQFEIIAEDLQDQLNNRILYTDVSFIMNIPQKINLTELCK